jgi:MFS family permease
VTRHLVDSPRVAPVPTSGPRREVLVLCATEITNWGALVYVFIVASSTIAATEDWQLTHLLGAFTVAQLVAGLTGVWVGRRIDAVGPRALMTAGSILGAISLVVVATSTSLPTFYAGWILAGIAMSAILYAPAFAAITGWAGTDVHQRIRGLTAVTLAAGLASTVFAPLTAWLLDALDWRATYLVMAALVAATAAAHWWGLRRPWARTYAHHAHQGQAQGDEATPRFRAGEFRLLVAAMALGGFCVHAVVVNLVPLLLENGLSLGAAATVMAVGGVGQVGGRLFYGRLTTITGPASRAWVTLGPVAVSTVAFAVIHSPWVLVAVVSFAGGMARGMFTLVQATAVSDRWGPMAYGARNGVLSGATMGAAALAPWAGSFLADHVGGFAMAFWILAVGMLVAAAGIRPTAGRRAPQT